MTGYGMHILPQHAELLGASAISPEVARVRGYVSVDTNKRLEAAGYASYQRRVPGLLIPVHDSSGAVALYQYRPDRPRTGKRGPVKYETPGGAQMVLDVPLGERARIGHPHIPLWITEGSRKADAAVSAGLCCVAVLGVWNWRGSNANGGAVALADWEAVALNGRQVYIAFDSDVMLNRKVHAALVRLGAFLSRRGATVAYVYLPPGESGSKTGLDDYFAAGGTTDDLVLRARAEPVEPELPSCSAQEKEGDGAAKYGTAPRAPRAVYLPRTIAQVEGLFARWLMDGDRVVTRVVMAAYIANMCLAGDPVWLILVGGSGAGKTERIMPVTAMPGVVMSSTITGEAALLSGTPSRDRATDATGGLLREIGDKGLLVLKDFTSVLEMSRDRRAEVLAALREVADGRWDRKIGSEGGRSIPWAGKCGMIAGCTGAIDKAHSVIATMGTRWVFVRLATPAPAQIGASALAHLGQEQDMRGQLREATAGLLSHLPGNPHPVEPMRDQLVALACLASQARSAVLRDSKGEIDLVLDAEAPTRLVKQLGQLWRAGGMLGLGEADTWELVRRAGLDSIPKLRGTVIRHLADARAPADTASVGAAVDHPSRSVRRALEDLTAHGVVTRITGGRGMADQWALSAQASEWLTAAGLLPQMAT